MRTYENLRADLNTPERVAKSMGKVFAQLARTSDGPSAAVVTAAALNVPRETIADLLGYDLAEVDTVVATFTARLTRQLRDERERSAT